MLRIIDHPFCLDCAACMRLFPNSNSKHDNFYHFVMDIAWFGVALAATTRFLSVFAIRLGASPAELGLLTSLPAIFMLLAATATPWWRRLFPNSLKAVFLPALGFRLMFFLLAFAPFLPEEWRPAWLIFSLVIPAIPQGIAGAVFLTLMRESVEASEINRLTSRRFVALNICIALAALIFGLWLETAPFPVNYQIMYLVAFLATIISLWHVMRVRPVAQLVKPYVPASSGVMKVWRENSFRQVALVVVVSHVAFFSVFAITPLHLVQNLGAAEGFMAIFGLVELAAGALIATVTTKIAARLGTRTMVGFGMAGTAAGTFIIAFSPNLYLTLFAAAFLGGAWTAVNVGLFGFFSEQTSSLDGTGATTAYLQIIGLSTFIGPMIGAGLAGDGTDLVPLLVLGGLLRFIAWPVIDRERFRHLWSDLRHKNPERASIH